MFLFRATSGTYSHLRVTVMHSYIALVIWGRGLLQCNTRSCQCNISSVPLKKGDKILNEYINSSI